MKKVKIYLSIILVFVILFTSAFPAYAADMFQNRSEKSPKNNEQHYERFIAMVGERFPELSEDYIREDYRYEELYTHQNAEDKADWVLVNATSTFIGADMWVGFKLAGNRALVMCTDVPFEFGMAVYDVEQDAFYDICKLDSLDEYEGLAEAVDAYGKGRLLGDIDNDDEISIVDATLIQRCQTGLGEYPESDTIDPEGEITESEFHPLRYYSDFNRDGERDIADATCIQRYVTGLSY